VILAEPGDGEPVAFAGSFTIGRGDCDLTIPGDEYVSPLHAKVSHSDAGWAVEDLGSTNGTYVNGHKVYRALLRKGDRIRVGRTIVTVVPY
jgi:pSer/pThr/pTyr-binding forkhead associated (FHA) protein